MPWKNSSVLAQRRALVRGMLAGVEAVSVWCRRFGVSRQTAYKFLHRFRREGLAGLRERSRRPSTCCSAAARRWRQRLLRLRRTHSSWGARKLRWLLQQRFGRAQLPGERTLQRWLQAAGLSRRRTRRRRRARARPQVRATRARTSNHVWTIDLKGWFRTGDGRKVEPLTIRDLYSRYVLWCQPLARPDEASVRAVCQRLFRRYGVPRVIRCDRGSPFFGDGPWGFTRLSLWWWRLGLRVEFVRRGLIDNNAHEQMHRAMQEELRLAPTPREQAYRLRQWRRQYNHVRPHEALGLKPPARVYRPRPRPLRRLCRPCYPSPWPVRRVQRNGEVSLAGWHGSIGRAFGGLLVGFAPIGPQRYRVYFARLLLGELDLAHDRRLLLAAY